MLNSRSVAKLMHIKQKIRGEHAAETTKKNEIDRTAQAAYDELNEQRLQSQSLVCKDLARQQESL